MLVFLDESTRNDEAEAWCRTTEDGRYRDLIERFFSEDPDDRQYEADRHLVGERAASSLVAENGGPDYRAWERIDHIVHSARSGG